MTTRTRIVLALGVVLLLLGAGLICCLRSPSAGSPAAALPRLPTGLLVLSDWDRRRAQAYATGDVAALDSLYVPGSRTGRRDHRLLRAYVDRGLVVRGMRMQVLACELVFMGARRIRVLVTDRLQGALVVGQSARDPTTIRLPADRPSRRVVTFVRRGGRWRVSEVSAATPWR
jgi:hypothetical protein